MPNVLVVYTHPIKDSFNRAVLKEVVKGLKEAGHVVDVADLYSEEFQPAMTKADFAQHKDKPPPADVLREQARVEWSDAIVLIFPLWWWTMPAMLKGWIDRVMTYGWAYVDAEVPGSATRKDRDLLVLTTAGTSQEALAKREYDKAFHTQLNVGVFNYCSLGKARTRIFCDVNEESPKKLLHGYLDEARTLARTFATRESTLAN